MIATTLLQRAALFVTCIALPMSVAAHTFGGATFTGFPAAEQLHPVCRDRSSNIRVRKTTPVLLTSTGYGNYFNVACFSAAAAVHKDVTDPHYCSAAVADETVFYASGVDKNGDERLRTVLSTAISGSMTGITFNTKQPLKFFIFAQNKYVTSACQLTLEFTMTAGYFTTGPPHGKTPVVVETTPVMRHMAPMVAYPSQPTQFFLTFPRGFSAGSTLPTWVAFSAIGDHADCGDVKNGTGTTGKAKRVQSGLTWTTVFPSPGGYKVCAADENGRFHNAAAVFIFGANPAYFETRRINARYSRFSFSGTDLNPVLDEVRFVGFDEPCAASTKPIASVRAEPLGPSGRNAVAVATVDAFIATKDIIRVCYYKQSTAQWHVVPNLWALNFDAKQTVQGTLVSNGTMGQPHAPKGCVTAPAMMWRTVLFLELSVAGKAMPATLPVELAKFLCVPAAVLSFHSKGSTASKHIKVEQAVTTVAFTVRCNTTAMCFSQERMNYVLYADVSRSTPEEQLRRMGILSVKASATEGLVSVGGSSLGVAATGTGSTNSKKRWSRTARAWKIATAIATVLCCMTLALIVAVVVRSRRQCDAVRRQRPAEIEFDDVQEMDENGDVIGEHSPLHASPSGNRNRLGRFTSPTSPSPRALPLQEQAAAHVVGSPVFGAAGAERRSPVLGAAGAERRAVASPPPSIVVRTSIIISSPLSE
jgi:hypothetical protein